MNFFTVSGMAPTRVSPAASWRTAIFTGARSVGNDVNDDRGDDRGQDEAPFQEGHEAQIIAHVHWEIGIVRAFPVRHIDHVSPLKLSVRRGLTNACALPQALLRSLSAPLPLGD